MSKGNRGLRSQVSHDSTAGAGKGSTGSRPKTTARVLSPNTPVTAASKVKDAPLPGSSSPTIALDSSLSSSIADIVRSVISSSNSLDALVARITEEVTKAVLLELRTSVGFTADCVGDLRQELDKTRQDLENVKDALAKKQDDLEQYTRRNSIRIFGLKESADENTDSLAINLFREKLNINMDLASIDRSHRVGSANNNGRPRPIIVKFTSYRPRSLIFRAKKQLKNSGISMREDLTVQRIHLYQMAVEKFGIKNVWTFDGTIVVKNASGMKFHVTSKSELLGLVH